MNNSVLLTEIICYLNNNLLDLYGDPRGIEIRHLKEPRCVDEFTLDWVSHKREGKQQIAEQSQAKAIISDSSVEYSPKLRNQKKVLISVENPRLAIAKIGNHFFKPELDPQIHPTAIIHPDAKIGNKVFIGPYVSIGACSIGDYVQIFEKTVIGDKVTIKDHVIIHSNAIIGTDGLGCERERDGTLIKFPHFGGVILEEWAEIGAQTVIARGALSDTIIGRGSKFNIGCFVAHNVIIGKNVWISPKVNIAGSVKIGDNTTIFSGAIIREQRIIGNNVTIGMGAVVINNIPDFETWIGNPAHKIEK